MNRTLHMNKPQLYSHQNYVAYGCHDLEAQQNVAYEPTKVELSPNVAYESHNHEHQGAESRDEYEYIISNGTVAEDTNDSY